MPRSRPTAPAAKKRSKSQPRYVWIEEDPTGRQAPRAAWTDPYAPRGSRPKRVTLSRKVYRTPADIKRWIDAKENELTQQWFERADNIKSGTSVERAFERYFEDRKFDLRETTVKDYRSSLKHIAAWLAEVGLRSLDDLDKPTLLGKSGKLSLRLYLRQIPRRVTARGAGRGNKRTTEDYRSALTVNNDLRIAGIVFRRLHALGLVPLIRSKDDFDLALEAFAEEEREIEIMTPSQLRQLLQAALRHDAETFTLTRDEHAGLREPGRTERYKPIAPYIAGVLLSGMREAEAITLDWSTVDLDAPDASGAVVGQFVVRAKNSRRSKKRRTVTLRVSPMLRELLVAIKRAGRSDVQLEDGPAVFGLTLNEVRAAHKRLVGQFGAPRFGWHSLRRTCGTYLVCAPGIFGGNIAGSASPFQAAQQLGHSVTIAQERYWNAIHGIPLEHKTLEAVLGCEAELREVVARARGTTSSGNVVSIAR
jgi:integrase